MRIMLRRRDHGAAGDSTDASGGVDATVIESRTLCPVELLAVARDDEQRVVVPTPRPIMIRGSWRLGDGHELDEDRGCAVPGDSE